MVKEKNKAIVKNNSKLSLQKKFNLMNTLNWDCNIKVVN
ncbi:hypothetical protein JCM19297_2048 [Nonlabens ulvanivorans]|nr:hypothetical protein JCM19297_2048 [Nonlabens ulvanivorans]